MFYKTKYQISYYEPINFYSFLLPKSFVSKKKRKENLFFYRVSHFYTGWEELNEVENNRILLEFSHSLPKSL